jgi:HSP20 family protein
MKIVKFNNKQIFPSLINEFFNDDFGVNFLNRNHSVPSVNTIENDDSFEIDLAVPGMKKDDFSIELDNNVLIISSETSNNVSNENLRLNEFNYSSFQRSFKIPESINLDKIKGNYKNGILKVLLPKKKNSISKTNRVISIG